MNNDKGKINNGLKKIKIVVTIQIILAVLFVFIFWGFLAFAGVSEGTGFLLIMIYPFYLAYVAINIVICIFTFLFRSKKIILISILAVILVSSPNWYSFFYGQYEKYFKSTDSCEKNNNENLKNYCYLDLARKRHDINICNNILDKSYRDSCYGAGAKNSNDCLVIKDENKRIFCLSEFK